ncbi:MAG: alpha/beta fold hydrolase [Planctomycetota bacterium]|jgi:pimeloyl-ACP methyl ester carboxylesterase
MSTATASPEIHLVSVPREGDRPASFWRRADGSPEGSKKSPILALAGLGLDGRAFEEVLALGEDRDLILANFANEPSTPRRSMDDFVDEALDILDAAGHGDRPAVVMGSSFGGMVAQAAALAHPDRVAALVLLGTGAGWSALPLRLKLLSRMHGLVGRRPYPRAFATIMMPPFKFPGSQLRETLRRQMLHRTKGYVGDCLDAMRGFDPRSGLAELEVPTLVIHGAGDPVFSWARGLELADTIPGARHVEVPRCGHLPQSTHPEIVVDEVNRFLAEVES